MGVILLTLLTFIKRVDMIAKLSMYLFSFKNILGKLRVNWVYID